MTHNVFRWVPIKGNDWYWIRHHIKPGMKVYVEILVNNLHSSRMFQRCLLALYRNSGYSSLVAKKKERISQLHLFIYPSAILAFSYSLSCLEQFVSLMFWKFMPLGNTCLLLCRPKEIPTVSAFRLKCDLYIPTLIT